MFIDAINGFEQGKTQNRLREEDIQQITSAYFRREAVEKYASLVTVDEIESNEFNLHISRYVDTYEPSQEISLTQIQREIHSIDVELEKVESEINDYIEKLNLSS
jgi:type I restriction enzyme M protein